ncbi:ATP-binding protein [Burkholderia vietnamiensis]|uniref:ATP-binding protein n=1 Tax=Burkholderia vietnamiensis TaxID=60552 RepID=UPI00402A6B01
MSDTRSDVQKRIANLMLVEFEAAVAEDEFGVVVQDTASFDHQHLLASLPDILNRTKGRLRLTLVGRHDDVTTFKETYPKYGELVASDEESAVQWRNQKKKTIIVVADGPLSKQGSLKDFTTLGENKLIRRLCDEERDRAQVTSLRTIWDALKSSRGPALSLDAIAAFAASLQQIPTLQRSVQAPAFLYALGLFPDTHLADESTEARVIRRLKTNADSLNMVINATPEDWERMKTFCRHLPTKEKVRFNAIRKRLQAVSQRTSKDLQDIELADVQTLWKGKLAPTQGDGDLGGSIKDGGKVPVESVVAELLLDGGTEQLADLAERVEQLADQAENDQTSGDDEPLMTPDVAGGGATSAVQPVTNVSSEVIALAKSRSTSTEWGGVIDVESDRIDALTEVSAFKAWMPFLFQEFKELLARFVEADLSPAVCLEHADQLAATRSALLRHIAELTVSPVTVLAGRPEVFAAAEDYLKAYDQLLLQLQAAFQEMYAQAGDEAEALVHWLLSMELYVYRRDDVTEVLLSPVHPLNLWRSVAIVRDLQTLGSKLSATERQTLVAASAEDLQLLNVLVLPHIPGLNGQASLLGHAGAIAHLPLFKEAPRGVLEPDGVKSISVLATLVAHLRPFARPGLQVVLVNAPRPGRFLEAVLDELDLDNAKTEDRFWGVHFRFRYTSDDTRGWTTEMEDVDDQVKDRIRAGQERGLISVSVDPEIKKWPELIDEVRTLPAHLTVVFDPFEVRTALVSRAGLHALSPWMPSREYRYNKLKKQIMIVPVAEEEVFATYFSTATLVHRELKQSTATHQPQVASVKSWLDQLADLSTWTVVADPHRVLVPRLGEAEVIDRRVENARQITTFGRDLSPFVRQLDQQLRKTHFVADPATLEELIRDLVAMEPNGILGLVGGDKGKHVKGALGKLIAMRWYRHMEPSGLAVSLDTQNARRWLSAGAHSNEKADLIGLREDAGELVIDVIEVKTHDENVPYSIQGDFVTGHAVDQVLATMHALAEIFGGTNLTPLAKPRREVVREHLYTALLRDLDPQYIERWHALLQDLFAGAIKVRLSGRLVHVQLASVATTPSVVKKSRTGVPIQINTLAATDVGLVLTASKKVKGEVPFAGSESVAGADTLDPARVFELLNSAGEAGGPQAPAEEAQEESSAKSNAAPSADPNAGLRRSSKSAKAERLLASPGGEQAATGLLEVSLGQETNTKQPVAWAPGKQSNGFFLILGASGSGKTETLKVLGKGIADYGVPVLVLDFHGDVQFPGLRSVLLSSGTSSTTGVNPMELDSQSAEETGLYDQRKVIRDMIRNAVPALGHRQGAILRDAIEEAYVSAGFNDSDPATWRNTPPTFADVQEILADWADDDSRKSQRTSIEGCLAAVQEIFEHPIFQRREHVSVDEILSRNVRLDLSKLTDEVRYITAETLLRKIFRVLRLMGPIPVQPVDDRQRFRLFVVIDEAKILSTGGGDPDSPERILNQLFTEARKFGLGMVLASQMSDHFGSEVKANAASWLVLKPMDVKEAKKNAPNVHMEPDALTSLRGKGDGYLRDRSSPKARRIQVQALPSNDQKK